MFEGYKREFLSAEGRLEFFAILEDVFASVPVGETEVEDFFAVKLRDAAGGRAETVEEPGEFGEGFELKDFETAGGFEIPGSGDFCWNGGARERLAGFAPDRTGFLSSGHLISIIGAGTGEVIAGD